jgi:subtilase family serine protease
MYLLKRPVSAVAAGIIGLISALAAVVPAAAAPVAGAAGGGPLVAMTASAAPALPLGASRLGALPAGMTLHLDVTLKVRDQAALTALLNGLANRNSPYFHRFLAPGQFGPLFGPTLPEVAAVRAALVAVGLTPGQVTPDRLAIGVTATAAEAERAFGVSLVDYRLAGGRVTYANTSAPRLPASVAPLVTGVLGLNDLYPAADGVSQGPVTAPAGPAGRREPNVPATAGPQPCSAAVAAASAAGSFTSNQLALHYGLAPLYKLGDLGRGVHVAVLEEQSYLASDIAGYDSCYGIHPTIRVVPVDGPVPPPAPKSSSTLMIEQLASLAPDSTIDVYETAATADPEFELISRAVDNDTDQVIVNAYYQCELGVNVSLAQSEETLAEEANAQDQTTLMDAGTAGSTACDGLTPVSAKATLAVSALAALPYVIGVGGTTLSGDAPLAPETVWNESVVRDDAGGGGLSTLWCMPDYQHQPAILGLISQYSKKKTSCQSGASSYARQVPDISADADAYTGYVEYRNGAWLGDEGGTDGAEAVIAAVAAIIDASPFCGDYGAGDAGLLPQTLYAFVAGHPYYVYRPSQDQEPEALGDIASGNNDYTPSGYTGGRYPATVGYDMATGLGYPLVSGLAGKNSGPIGHPAPSAFYPGLAAGMCYTLGTRNVGGPAVTAVTPDAGPAGHPITVRVHGRHFLPIAGADLAKVFLSLTKSYILPANCSSATLCTVTLPALSARTINVQIDAEDTAYSNDVGADRFMYAFAPRITKLSPAKGRRGTRVTIHGGHFTGVRAVYFGHTSGTSVKVVSATEITVVAPAGSGAVRVTVVAAGGPSNAVNFAY